MACSCLSFVYAGPQIAIDTPVVDVGSIREKSGLQIEHTFKIRNTGDAPLRILSVRPECSCTVVEFDSVIAPGSSGQITGTVKIANFYGGPFTKAIYFSTNIADAQASQLTIRGKLLLPVNLSPTWVRLIPSMATQVALCTLSLSTDKNNFAITACSIVMDTLSRFSADSIYPTWTLTKHPETPDADGYTHYILALKAHFFMKKTRYGFIRIATNHPQRPILSANAILLKP